ncbi:hypothetical protein M427DRAFT_302630 [Gonapodya prolifera JEL478]|uniref:Uncharacterized protein n=1 Tax=Gonapodya prolifera (strain JEL478) TaxID=1344416 RepID=A0A139AHC4_GONPJ|nr:hypothetical protein M427DRAFT_302630 [Gonapodya prolifera JEL478]|eukprot:KXS16206.1 hypothetical protein M427DRAFT_302630 [Gonapodya prolifera JEL478]
MSFHQQMLYPGDVNQVLRSATTLYVLISVGFWSGDFSIDDMRAIAQQDVHRLSDNYFRRKILRFHAKSSRNRSWTHFHLSARLELGSGGPIGNRTFSEEDMHAIRTTMAHLLLFGNVKFDCLHFMPDALPIPWCVHVANGLGILKLDFEPKPGVETMEQMLMDEVIPSGYSKLVFSTNHPLIRLTLRQTR